MLENTFKSVTDIFGKITGRIIEFVNVALQFATNILGHALDRPYWSIGLLVLLLAGRGSKTFKLGNSQIKL